MSSFLFAPAVHRHLAVLTPAQLKALVLDLATRDLLTDIPDKTPNLLLFNNATVNP
jgi:hypothetical protein